MKDTKDTKVEALATIRMILEGFAIIEEDADVNPGEEIKGRCTLAADFEGQSLIVRIRTNEVCGKVLVGHRGANLASLQQTFFTALGFRMGHIPHSVWLEVNGRRPDLRRTSEERSPEPAAPPEVEITVKAPEGVKVKLVTATG